MSKTKIGDVFELKAKYVMQYLGSFNRHCGSAAANDALNNVCKNIKTTPNVHIKCVYVDDAVAKTSYRYYFFEVLSGPDTGKILFNYGAGLRDMYRRLPNSNPKNKTERKPSSKVKSHQCHSRLLKVYNLLHEVKNISETLNKNKILNIIEDTKAIMLELDPNFKIDI